MRRGLKYKQDPPTRLAEAADFFAPTSTVHKFASKITAYLAILNARLVEWRRKCQLMCR